MGTKDTEEAKVSKETEGIEAIRPLSGAPLLLGGLNPSAPLSP